MKKNLLPKPILLLVLVLAALGARHAGADVRLPTVIDSHMVLQRDLPLPIWGWASAGEDVSVRLDDNKAISTKADEKGAWKLTLPAVKADGKPHKLTISGKNKIELIDILIGDVWVGSGQSNMEWHLRNTIRAKESIAAADRPKIRLFHVPKVHKEKPADDVEADWTVCTPKTVARFSGVLYHFGLRLHKDLDIPIGLINSSWGGSRIEPWTVTDKDSGKKYNGMIAPLQPLAIRGVIWYQGESNVKNGMAYYDKKKALINGWRKSWELDLPFYFVQLAPFAGYKPGHLPALWEAQVASLKIPGTGMVVITDLVDKITDIHPRNKFDVGNRLALWALARNYGKTDLVYSGPLYKSRKKEAGKIRLGFAHAGGGLKSRDGKPLSEFQICGVDGRYHPAQAKIDGETVVVWSDAVKKPAHVTFGWHKVANPNLVNASGLPASPFVTHGWKGGTGEKP